MSPPDSDDSNSVPEIVSIIQQLIFMNHMFKSIYLILFSHTLFSKLKTKGIYCNTGLSNSKLLKDLSICQKFLFYVKLILQSLSKISYIKRITIFLDLKKSFS